MSTLNGKSVASTYDQVVKRQDSYSATGNQIEIMDDSGVIKTTPLYLDSVNSRVGIGTASPDAKLHILSTTEQLRLGYDASTYGGFTMSSGGDMNYDASGDEFDFWGGTSGSKYVDIGQGATGTNWLRVFNNSVASITLKSDGEAYFAGNVGIGTASPDANTKLDVAGVIRASGGIQPNGNAYSASEVLDDYEEGTFTFQFYDAVSGGNASATTNTGHYTKIGNVVVARVYAYNNPSTSGMTSGNVLYFTLPFTAGANGYTTGACIVRGVDLNSRTSIATDLRGSASRGTFQTIGDGLDMANVLVSHWTSGSDDLNMLTLTYAT